MPCISVLRFIRLPYGVCFGTASLLFQGQRYYLFHFSHVMECQAIQIVMFYFLDIFAVVLAKDDFLYPRTFCREDFFLYSAYWQYLSAQGYLAGHGYRRFYLASGEYGHERGKHRYAGRRPVFRRCSFRYMHVDIIAVYRVHVESEMPGVGFDVLWWPIPSSRCQGYLSWSVLPCLLIW